MKKHYLFDFDGVLVDSMPVWAGTYVKMLEQHGVPVPDGFVRRITPLGNAGAARCLIEAGLQMTEDEILRCAMERFDYEYGNHIALKPNVAETLQKLIAAGNAVHVLTGSSHRYVDPCLKRHGVFDLFENVWSVDDFPYTKAQPEIYLEAAKRLQVPLSQCVFLDDNFVAVSTAVKAGMPTIAVYDASSADFADRMKATADGYITDFSEFRADAMAFDPDVLKREIGRTNPDFVLFCPKNQGYEDDNVHVHVVRHEKSGKLIAIWTQSSYDSFGDNHAMIAYSDDDGKTWTEPRYIMGTRPGHGVGDKQASWAFPVISRSGRIYLFYFRETDYDGNSRSLTAAFACRVSDDCGLTWSESTDIPMRMTPYDECAIQNNNIYQVPRRLPDGRYLFAYTKWTGYRIVPSNGKFYEDDAHLYFMRCENLDDDPEPKNLRFTFLPDDEHGIGILNEAGDRSYAQEPCWTALPDGRLFCSMRTALGYAAYTVSSDGGHSWRKPEPIRFSDGSIFVHPLSPCPIYETGPGEYVLLYHGHAEKVYECRNPLYRAKGTFDPDARQPIRFEAADRDLFMELPEDAEISGHTAKQLAMYASAVRIGDRTVLWYPDRKCFLLGKYLD